MLKKFVITLSLFLTSFAFIFTPLVLAGPASTNFQLKEYGFGAGGLGPTGAFSSNYKAYGAVGETETGQATSANYKIKSGLTFTIQANVPPAPILDNGSNTYYNKLTCTLSTGSNPSTTEFAIAISSNGFSTTSYVQADDTLGATAVWQTNAIWGASGFTIIGLTPGATYSVKVAARMGNFTQSPYGPTATKVTVNPSISFSRTPSTINFGTLPVNTVTNSPTSVTVSLDTNAAAGGNVYVYSTNGGLLSSHTSHKITSLTGDLSLQTEGSGAQATAASATSGTFSSVSPYNGTSSTVGIVDSTIRTIFTASSPITGGSGTFQLKAKISNTTPAASDYAETVTVIASATF